MTFQKVFRDKGGNILTEQEKEQFEIRRIKLPKADETIGILDQRLGGSRMKVRCMNGKTLICRVPGRLKRKLWVREGDVLLIKPWGELGEDKGDVVFKYKPTQIGWLRKNGHMKNLEVDEF